MTGTRTPVSGGGADEGAPDGVSGSPATGGPESIQGRSGGSESSGGAYPNPQTGKTGDNSGFLGHGGQTEIGYHGGGQAGEGDAPNSATGSDSDEGSERGAAAPPTAERHARPVHAGGRSFDVIETDGIEQAEATAKVGTDAPYEREQHSPGAG